MLGYSNLLDPCIIVCPSYNVVYNLTKKCSDLKPLTCEIQGWDWTIAFTLFAFISAFIFKIAFL